MWTCGNVVTRLGVKVRVKGKLTKIYMRVCEHELRVQCLAVDRLEKSVAFFAQTKRLIVQPTTSDLYYIQP